MKRAPRFSMFSFTPKGIKYQVLGLSRTAGQPCLSYNLHDLVLWSLYCVTVILEVSIQGILVSPHISFHPTQFKKYF